MAKVTMPQLGESVAEGTIGRWLKQPGDTVAKYEPLVEVITDKVNAEVPSPFAGVLREILAEEGATVPNNAEIAVIETEDEALAGGSPAAGASPPPRPAPASDGRPASRSGRSAPAPAPAPPPRRRPASPRRPAPVAPAAAARRPPSTTRTPA